LQYRSDANDVQKSVIHEFYRCILRSCPWG